MSLQSKPQSEGITSYPAENRQKRGQFGEMRIALEEIASFGRSQPGHGYSCATIAIKALETLDD